MTGGVNVDGNAETPGHWPGWDKLAPGQIAAFVVFVWAVAGFAPVLLSGEAGTLGDSFGVVNSLFSGLGVAGVAYALILQSQEQRANREAARQASLEAETNRRHVADLAMTAALISAHTAMMNYQIENYRQTSDKLLHHRDMIDIRHEGKVLNEQAERLLESYDSVKRLADDAERKMRDKAGELGEVR